MMKRYPLTYTMRVRYTRTIPLHHAEAFRGEEKRHHAMLVYEYKIAGTKKQYAAIDEAI